MIFDNIKNAEKYYELLPFLRKAFDFLPAIADLPCGKSEIDGENVYASIQECKTAPADCCPFEHHKRYIDVHYVISGEERIDFCPRSECVPTTEFDIQNDYELCEKGGNSSSVILSSGDFAILWPGEAHAPKIAVTEPMEIRKIVFKIIAD